MATNNIDPNTLYVTNRMLQRQANYGKAAAEVINSEKWAMLIEGFQNYRMFEGNIHTKPNHLTYMFEAINTSLYSEILKRILPYSQNIPEIDNAVQKIVASRESIHNTRIPNMVDENDPTIVDNHTNNLMHIWGIYSTIEENLKENIKEKDDEDDVETQTHKLLERLGFYDTLDDNLNWIQQVCRTATTATSTHPRNPSSRENKRTFQKWEKTLFNFYINDPTKLQFSTTPVFNTETTPNIENTTEQEPVTKLTPELNALLDMLNETRTLSAPLLSHFNSEEEHFYESLFNQHIPNSINVFNTLTSIGDDTTEAAAQFAQIITQSNTRLININEQVRENIRKESLSHFASTSTIIKEQV